MANSLIQNHLLTIIRAEPLPFFCYLNSIRKAAPKEIGTRAAGCNFDSVSNDASNQHSITNAYYLKKKNIRVKSH